MKLMMRSDEHILNNQAIDYMQTYRINNKLPQAYRIIKLAQPTQARTMFSFPRFPSGEFAPLFRLLDDYASHQISRQGDDLGNFSGVSQLRSFQPRFDVKEVKDGYELHGELPGVDQKDIQIEFTDPQTLSIKGRTERHHESGTPPAALEGQQEKGRITSGDEPSDASSQHYHKPTVEDETAMSGAQPSDQQVTTTNNQSQEVQQQTDRPQSRYWVSERSVGEFSRSFAFPSRVDQDNVRASLKNGILSIVVPKASAPATRKINIE
ncbi:HSP20-like chaperone [Aureobasidium subglaciale]|nr:HSP20-like chaperone [Aureobasidium subglaciale]KAI5221279.1 HSP20-like chaperone [Aureobasidium subglaciale]KAI5225203.1 HSP20-like chaperone [Aureobasidium subglaciale]KAI5251682.1 HSP20-like chaperone [Aureobasidium subglaciale]KAI5261359.1 HSP20-like chaperone [Aureobasidium subglaciale]